MIYDLHTAPDILSDKSRNKPIASNDHRKYAVRTSINASIRFLIFNGLGKKRDAS
jgi:hypothetical protein